MRIECIAIGTELLTASRVDTNSIWIASRLADLGLAFHRKSSVGDDPAELRSIFMEALSRSDFIVCTGGLGPTFDDVTKELWAEILGAPLREDPQVRADIEGFYMARQRVPPPSNWKQALVPQGSEVLRNGLGTAPGIWWQDPEGHLGVRIVLLPGVPKEMERMWAQHVEPRLRPLAQAPVHTLRLVVGGVPESALDQRTQGLREKHRHLDWTILAPKTHVELLLRSADDAALEAARRDLEIELGEDLVCLGDGSVESTVLNMLCARRETLALAESMTGGLLAARLTAIPGASDSLLGGAVVYSAQAKATLAGLDPAFLREHGTVSEAVTRALAESIRHRLGASWGLAITGTAGPTEDKDGPAPVGTCHVAVASASETSFRTFLLPGDRADIQLRSASWALDLLRRSLTS